ncbi:hypothetical protein ACQ4M4_12550 [Leptolyngbya sp. AN02str]|uniref:hypothetical protein n=1 Tax=Leptolyngbya sp. AN02str TaxID=3423363 RepID=UPI003D316B57
MQAIAQAEAELTESTEAGLLEDQSAEGDSPASPLNERAIGLQRQIEQWQQILQKLE